MLQRTRPQLLGEHPAPERGSGQPLNRAALAPLERRPGRVAGTMRQQPGHDIHHTPSVAVSANIHSTRMASSAFAITFTENS